MNMEPLREFVSLEKKKKDLDAELKAAKQRLDELEEIIIPHVHRGRRALDGGGGRRHDAHAVDLPGRVRQPDERPRRRSWRR